MGGSLIPEPRYAACLRPFDAVGAVGGMDFLVLVNIRLAAIGCFYLS